jgi:hypothetical protein
MPFRALEPVLGSFAHIVAFHEDRKTVVHIHPTSAGPVTPAMRAGPEFPFRFYPPKAGTYRLYVQVRSGDRDLFAPFAVVAAP